MFRKRLLVLGLVLVACGGDSGNGPNQPPGLVAHLSAQVVSGEVVLSWDPASLAESYSIYMASQSGVTRINHQTLPGNMFHPDLALTFDHPPGLDPNTTYFFVVTAVNSRGISGESCEVSVTIAGAIGGSC